MHFIFTCVLIHLQPYHNTTKCQEFLAIFQLQYKFHNKCERISYLRNNF